MAVLTSVGRRRITCLWLVWFTLLAAGGLKSAAQTPASKEYQIKAAFLFNFAQFIDWPSTAFANTNTPFCIGILGDDPFGPVLDKTVQDENVNGHPLVIQRYREVAEATNCQVLFVSRSETKRLKDIFTGLKNPNILTVGEVEGFCKGGGAIRFVMEQNKIHFRISPDAVKNASLTASSKLLRLAEIVSPGGD